MRKFIDIVSEKMVYHGTPHQFTEFDTDKINSGEGAQAFGWGLYFTDTHGIAAWYKNNVHEIHIDSEMRKIGYKNSAPVNTAYYMMIRGVGSEEQVMQRLKTDYPSIGNVKAHYYMMMAKKMIAVRNKLLSDNKGKLFEVDIPDNDEDYLLWDSPLAQQSAKVTDIIHKFLEANPDVNPRYIRSGEHFYHALTNKAGSDKNASLGLYQQGLVGIKYLGQRNDTNHISTDNYNYVIFDKSSLKVRSIT